MLKKLWKYLTLKLYNLFKMDTKENLTRKQIRNILRRESKKNKNMESKLVRLAVYGTLCRGQNANLKLLKDATYLGTLHTAPEYTLYDLKYYPGLVKNGFSSVKLEIFEMDEKHLSVFDKIEGFTKPSGNAHNVFERNTIETPFGTSFIYYYNGLEKNIVKPKEIGSGDWLNR